MKKKNCFSKKEKIILGSFLLTSAAWCMNHFFITKVKEEKVCEKEQGKHGENNLMTMKWSLMEINNYNIK